MASRLMRRFRLPPSPRSLVAVRSLLRGALAEVQLESLIDVALLLATELCSNAVRHAGTEMELAVSVDNCRLTVAVTDRGPVPLELNMATGPGAAQPRSGGYGLRLVAALASSWGTRHDATGRHVVWFSLEAPQATAPAIDPADALDPAPVLQPPPTPGDWPQPQICRWLLHIPEQLTARLDVSSLVAELLRRLCEVIGADEASVSVDHGDGGGEQLLARYGGAERLLARYGGAATRPVTEPPSSTRSVIDVRLALEAPLHGRLRVLCPPSSSSSGAADEELADLSAHRIALAIESDWLRGADRRRRSWMTYLADTSELLAQSLDVNFTAALVPQIVVPRLGGWCAVHLVDEQGKITGATWGHADESALAPLRSWLDGEDGVDEGALRRRIDEAMLGTRPVTFATPVEGVTVPLIARGTTLGTLTVGRSPARSHTPEDVALICDVARRASLALSNAQLNAAHVTVSQAFQRALLPRALPVAERVEFAAEYLPASAGTDVGGDFYDVLALLHERWLVSCGDVCGKGAPAAARTGLVRDVLRVLVRDGCRLERAIRLLNDAMGEPVGEQQFCTLAAALVSSRANNPGLTVELVLAGHDQPLVLRADGSTRFLGEFGTAVGVVADMQLWTTRHILAPGDAMVIYTDGVTERRNGAEFFGRTRLAELATRFTGAPAATIAAGLRTATKDFSPDPPKDDIALLVVKAR